MSKDIIKNWKIAEHCVVCNKVGKRFCSVECFRIYANDQTSEMLNKMRKGENYVEQKQD